MGSESPQTSTVVWVIVAVAVVFQTILLVAIAASLAKISRSLDQLTADVRSFLAVAKGSIERVEPKIHQMSQLALRHLEQFDHVSVELLARSRLHVVAFDKLLGDLLRTAAYANSEIEQSTRRAFREAHALSAGVRAALGYVFSRRRREASERGPNGRL